MPCLKGFILADMVENDIELSITICILKIVQHSSYGT